LRKEVICRWLEKALKALITALRRQPPKTHDIEALLETLKD
jgi:HEPN domain-containing protein